MKTNFKHPHASQFGCLRRVGGLVLVASLLYGCGESASLVRVTRHGGITFDSSMVLTVGDISGDQAKEIRADLRKALRANSDFKLLNTASGQEVVSDSTYASIASGLAEKKQTLVVLRGRYKVETDVNHKEKEGPNNTKKKYIERTVTGKFSFHLSDLPNKTLSFSRELQASSTEEKDDNWLLNTIVEAVLSDPPKEEVRRKVIDEFINELYPHEEVYQAKFFKDSEMPELETGIAHANVGRWDEAIELFKSVPVKYPANVNIHKAYYNLGIAYKWNNMFSEARESLEKAYLLKNTSEYYDEIQALAQFEEDYRLRQKEWSRPVQ